MNISVVIPAYNESGNIRSMVGKLFSAMEKIPELKKVEVIVVDDHSSDDTFQAASSMQDPRLSCIRLSRRSGSHTAIRAGIRAAKGDAVLCIAADGQDDPLCVAQMAERLRRGADVVWALRKDRKNEPLVMRQFAAAFYRVLLWLARAEFQGIDFSRADFFLLDRKVVDAIVSCPEKNTSLFGLIGWVGFKQESVEYERKNRKAGRSKWSFRSRLHLAKDWIVAFSGLPLFLMYVLGAAITAAGVALGVIAAFFRLLSGHAAVILFMLVLCGMQLIAFGLLGEYVWRNLDESRQRPLFFIEKRTR